MHMIFKTTNQQKHLNSHLKNKTICTVTVCSTENEVVLKILLKFVELQIQSTLSTMIWDKKNNLALNKILSIAQMSAHDYKLGTLGPGLQVCTCMYYQPCSQARFGTERKTLVGYGHVAPTFSMATNKINVHVHLFRLNKIFSSLQWTKLGQKSILTTSFTYI